MDDFINKLEYYSQIINDKIVYHGTRNIHWLDYINTLSKKMLWFSFDEKESELIPFDVPNERYWLIKDKYPIVIKLHLIKPVKVINLWIVGKNYYLKKGNEMEKLFNNEFEEEYLDYIARVNDIEINRYYSIIDRNILIMKMLENLNERYGTTFDGYRCENDQNEIAIFSNITYFNNIQCKIVDFIKTANALFTYNFEEFGEIFESNSDTFIDGYNRAKDKVKYMKSFFDNLDSEIGSIVTYENGTMFIDRSDRSRKDFDIIYGKYSNNCDINEQLKSYILNNRLD